MKIVNFSTKNKFEGLKLEFLHILPIQINVQNFEREGYQVHTKFAKFFKYSAKLNVWVT